MRETRPYILNWIKQNGGAQPTPPNLEEKSVTITTNTTTEVTPSEGYDGLSKVNVNVNVTNIDFVVPASIRFGSSIWSEIPLNFNFSQCDDFSYMFSGNTNLLELRSVDSSNAYNFKYTFSGCSKLVTVNAIDTGKGREFNYCFQNCVKLENLPVLDFSSMTNNIDMFSSCPLLTNQSLNNILNAIAHGTSITNNVWKTLKRMGLTSTQATTCQSLSNWDAFVAAGWSTGY